jgi:hypothetical protein
MSDITDLLRWDAKCKGVTFLDEDEFYKHNSNLKVSIYPTWK